MLPLIQGFVILVLNAVIVQNAICHFVFLVCHKNYVPFLPTCLDCAIECFVSIITILLCSLTYVSILIKSSFNLGIKSGLYFQALLLFLISLLLLVVTPFFGRISRVVGSVFCTIFFESKKGEQPLDPLPSLGTLELRMTLF